MSKMKWYGKSPSGADVEFEAEIALDNDAAAVIDSRLKTLGFIPSQRFAPPSFGGGRGVPGKKPDLAPPPGIQVKVHCDVPMKYIRYRKDGAKGAPERGVEPGWADMWVCSKDKLCEDVVSGKSDRAHANFDMKKATAEEGSTPPETGGAPQKSNGAKPAGPPQGVGEFMNIAFGELKYTRTQIKKFAQLTDAELDGLGPDGWADLLSKLRAERKTEAA